MSAEEAAIAYGYLMVEDTLRPLRLRAGRELMMLGPHLEAALPMLLVVLKSGSGDTELVCTAIHCLAMVGKQAKRAVPQLKRLVASKDEDVAARARSALKRIE